MIRMNHDWLSFYWPLRLISRNVNLFVLWSTQQCGGSEANRKQSTYFVHENWWTEIGPESARSYMYVEVSKRHEMSLRLFFFTSGDQYGYVKVIKCPHNSTNQTTMLNLKTNSCDFRSGCDEMCDEQSRVGENWSHTRWLWFEETITFRKAKINTLTTFSNTKVFLSCGWMFLFLIFDDFITAKFISVIVFKLIRNYEIRKLQWGACLFACLVFFSWMLLAM